MCVSQFLSPEVLGCRRWGTALLVCYSGLVLRGPGTHFGWGNRSVHEVTRSLEWTSSSTASSLQRLDIRLGGPQAAPLAAGRCYTFAWMDLLQHRQQPSGVTCSPGWPSAALVAAFRANTHMDPAEIAQGNLLAWGGTRPGSCIL